MRAKSFRNQGICYDFLRVKGGVTYLRASYLIWFMPLVYLVYQQALAIIIEYLVEEKMHAMQILRICAFSPAEL